MGSADETGDYFRMPQILKLGRCGNLTQLGDTWVYEIMVLPKVRDTDDGNSTNAVLAMYSFDFS